MTDIDVKKQHYAALRRSGWVSVEEELPWDEKDLIFMDFLGNYYFGWRDDHGYFNSNGTQIDCEIICWAQVKDVVKPPDIRVPIITNDQWITNQMAADRLKNE